MHQARLFTLGALMCSAFAGIAMTGCEKKADPVAAAQVADKKAEIPVPGIAEVKAIAEEAFIYGLPLVMNYAVMKEFVVDKNSGQYKAPVSYTHLDVYKRQCITRLYRHLRPA